METTVFYNMLSTTMLNSLGKGLLIFLLVKLLLSLSPALRPAQRFNLYYAALVLIFFGFIFSLTGSYVNELARAEAASGTAGRSADHIKATAATGFGVNKWIAVIYLAGLALNVFRLLTGFYFLERLKRKSNLQLDAYWQAKIQNLADQIGLVTKVTLKFAAGTLSPFAAGFLKPVIIFPIAQLNNLSEDQVEAILLHELAHIKRQDYLLNIFLRIMESLLFFNPFVWMLSREIKKEREFACDDLVIGSGSSSEVYAHALLELAQNSVTPASLSMPLAGTHKHELFQRIKRFTNMTTPNNQRPGLIALVTVIAACLSLAWAVPSGDIKLQEQKSNAYRHNDTLVKAPVAPTPPAPLKALAPLAPLKPKVSPPAPPAPPAISDTATHPADHQALREHAEALKKHAAELKKHFDSPEWTAKISTIKKHQEELKKHMESPEWKNSLKKLQLNAIAMKDKFESPEWKAEIENFREQAKIMKIQVESPEHQAMLKEIKAHAEIIRKEFNDPVLQQKIRIIQTDAAKARQLTESDEFKQQIEIIKKQAEKVKVEALKIPSPSQQ